MKNLQSWETEYRNFIIHPSSNPMGGYDYVSDDYDWAPDGQSGHNGWANTIEEAKDEIDTYYYENTHYRVRRDIASAGETITKFYSLVEAFLFAEKVNGEVEMYVDGERVDFDAI